MSQLTGKRTDMGDVVIVEQWLVKGQHWTMVFHLGAPRDVLPGQRPAPRPTDRRTNPERIDLMADLAADKALPLSVAFADELGNAVPAPDGAVTSYSVDNTEVIALTDNGDGTAVAAATGVLGNAVVSVSSVLPNGRTVTGDLLLSVVAGEAERVTVVPGDPFEVTPDEEPAPPVA